MIAAVDIFNDVEADVTALNGEIVRRAFHGTCCKFFVNQAEFRSLLVRYTGHKMEVHRAKIAEERWWRDGRALGSRHYEMLSRHKFDAEGIRNQLKKIWPCAACIWLYNPTHRLRRFPELAC